MLKKHREEKRSKQMQRSKQQKGKGGERINPVSLKPCNNQRAKRPHPCRKTVFIKKFCRGSCFCLSHGFSMCFVRIWVCPWIIGTELSLHTCTARKAVGRERGPSVKIWHGVLEVIYLSRWPLFWGACLGGCS